MHNFCVEICVFLNLMDNIPGTEFETGLNGPRHVDVKPSFCNGITCSSCLSSCFS